METAGIVQQVRRELAEATRDEGNLRGADWAGGESVWLAKSVVQRIASRYYREVGHLPRPELFALCEALLETEGEPERVIAFDWAFRCRKHFEEADFARFEAWLRRYVHGWGSCDDFCTHAFGCLIYQYPELIAQTMEWARSDSRWLRRAAAVVLIYSVRRRASTGAAFQVADILLTDQDDMVQKGYGWLLKEISNHEPGRVFDYVMAHKAAMPRTALRYAIEKLPAARRAQAMAR